LQVYIQIIEHWQLRHGKCPNCSTTFEYVQIGSTGKHQIYCPKAGCGYMINSAACSGGTHANEGKCQYCYYKYQTHSQTTTISTYTKTTTTHEPAYKCSYSGCTTTFRGTPKNHGGGTHQNGGKCTVCEYVYQTHGQSTTLVDNGRGGYIVTSVGHNAVYKCKASGCSYTYTGASENHSGATHDNEGICKKCNEKYQTHSKTSTVSSYTKTDTKHTPEYKCSYSGCTSTFPGTAANHSGATHANGGKCTTCQQGYQKHSKSTTISNYIKKETQHTPVYACSYGGCTSTYNGTAENHEGATHENGGKCTTCEQVYQVHSQSTTVSSYTKTETQHIPVYECSYSGCTSTYDGTAENHGGATHENGGKCTTCEQVYQTHGKSTTISKYETTEATHTPIYKCSYSECTSTYDGTAENHEVAKWTDNTNGTHSGECIKCKYGLTKEHNYESGKCKDCGVTEPAQKCNHSYTKKNDEKNHWEECSKCKEIKSGSLENHKYSKYTNNGNGTHSATCTVCNYKLTKEHNYKNGECIDCNATEPTQNCEHSYTKKNDAKNHWEECSKCKEIKSGTLGKHIFSKYIDNKNGTHTATCTVCGYKLTEKHESSESCEDCKGKQEDNKCDHTYIMQNDKSNHWAECSKCKEIKAGSTENHIYGKYIDNKDGTHTATCEKCGYQLTEKHNTDEGCNDCAGIGTTPDGGKDNDNNNNNNNNTSNDNTTIDKDIPKAGVKSIILVVIVGIGCILVVTKFKINKYKDI